MSVLTLGVACNLALQSQPDGATSFGLRRIERELTERLRWEILWNESTIPIRPQPSASLAVYLTPKSLFYCSHELGKCAQYGIEANRLGQRIKSIACGGSAMPRREGQQDAESLSAFIHQSDATLPLPSKPGQVYTLGGTVGGTPMKPWTPVTWTMTAALGTRQEIIDRYMQSPPAELASIKEWFHASLQNGVYKFLMFPCFSISDPEVYVYGDREERGPIIISLKWDREEEQWLEAGLLEVGPIQGRRAGRKIEELRRIIESMVCATLTPD